MANIIIAPPDLRVNLGAGTDGTVTVAVKVTLTAAEADIIGGPVEEFVTDWVSPSLSALGEWLGTQAVRDDCRICGGRLIGGELGFGTCGQCGGRAVPA